MIRYYYIKIYELYHYKILTDLKIHIFNTQYLSLGASYCNDKMCDNDKNSIFSSFIIIFSYPNITDINLNLIDYLLKNNSIHITNLKFDLYENVIIENNLFGYQKEKILIAKIIKNGDIIISSDNNENELTEGDYIDKENKIKFIFSNEEIFSKMNIIIEYMLYIQKPDYSNYNDHSVFIDDTFADINDENDYNNEALVKRTGRLGKFNFYLDNDLTTQCEYNKCKLCLFENRTQCITCNKDNYTLDENNFTKICIKEDEPIDINTSETNDYSDINSLYEISDKSYDIIDSP